MDCVVELPQVTCPAHWAPNDLIAALLEGGAVPGTVKHHEDAVSKACRIRRALVEQRHCQGPDGSVYVTADVGGKVWRIVYSGM